MARTRSVHYDDNQNLILDRAAELFSRQGFSRTAINEISRACGGSKAWVYHYFPSKEEILYQMLLQHCRRLIETCEEASGSGHDAETRFRNFVRVAIGIYAKSKSKHIVMLNDLDCLPPDRRRDIVALERRLVDMLVELLEGLNPQLRARPELRKPYAMLFYGMLNWTYTWYNEEGVVPPRRLAVMMSELFLNGYRDLPVLTADGEAAEMPAS